MKLPLLAVLSLAVFSPAASGRLFDTPEELVQRMDGNVFQGEAAGTFPFEAYKSGHISRIVVKGFFFKGKCLAISYDPNGPASEEVFALILEKNRGESSWTPQGDHAWIRADGAAFACRSDKELWIVATEVAPNWEAFQAGRYTEALIKSALEKL